jgi:peptide/nickel transport system substrate-binding protein
MHNKAWLAGLVAICLGLSTTTEAKTFRYAAASPILTLDPHASTDPVTMMVLMNVYEALVGRDQNLALVAGLATKWEATEPTTWRFTLRQGVHFDEGQPFTAADAKFSIERASGGMFNQFTTNIADVVVVDDHTLDVRTKQPDPLLPRWLSAVAIVNRDWALAHDSSRATTISANQEQYVVRHANGTGMFKLAAWDASSGKATLERNDGWWGQSDSNVTTAEFIPIASGPTRVAALLSGDVDLLRDVPTSDIARIKADTALKLEQRPSFRQMMLLMSPAPDT